MVKESIKSQISKLPSKPGVYLFKNKNKQIIYIGKAINLKSRVRSYWNETSWNDRPKLKFLVPKIEEIETIICKSEKEALILESNLVFKHQPRYNVLLKDNKSFPWLVITYDEAFPRLIPVRNADVYRAKSINNRSSRSQRKGKNLNVARKNDNNSKNKFFGPYTNIGAMWENLNLVHELFPLRKKKTPPFKYRPCLNYDLGKCLGPCQGLISEASYGHMLEQVEMLLNGNFQDLEDILSKEMYEASETEDFEKAAKLRDQIKSLQTFNEKQNVISQNSKLEQDTFVLVIDEDSLFACAQVFKTRAGKLINRETLEIDLGELTNLDRSNGEDELEQGGISSDEEKEVLESLVSQYYGKLANDELPREILLSHETQTEGLSEWLSERKGKKVQISSPKRGDKYSQIELAKRNAKVILEKLKLEEMEEASKDINLALANLQKELGMRTEPARIECYDISHIQGSDTVASLVCFTDGLPDKNQYRKFKISIDQNNDFDSMKEVLDRRFRKPEALPNLIIIDGGKGQLNAAKQILDERELGHIAIVGLAKKEEEIYEPSNPKPIILDRRSPELFLVQRIRNEAHRFAISFHRQLRSKRALKSSLDNIPGLGPAKKKALLDHFGTLSKIKKADPKEIASLKGFSEALARNIIGGV